MVRFYTDHDVSLRLVEVLHSRGYQATAARGLGHQRALDYEHLLLAAQHGWTLITHNRKDFTELHGAWVHWPRAWKVAPRPTHAGILVLRHAPVSSIYEALDTLLRTEPLLPNALYWWHGQGRKEPWSLWQPDAKEWRPVPTGT